MIPNRTVRLHGRHPHCHQRQPNAPPTNHPPGPGQIRRRILLPLTHQMRVQERKGRLPRSHHQPRKDSYRSPQSRRTKELATKTQYLKASTIDARNTGLPKTIHPGVRSHCTTTHQPPEERSKLPMDRHTQQSHREIDQHHP